MSDHKTNHAASAGACQANGVRGRVITLRTVPLTAYGRVKRNVSLLSRVATAPSKTFSAAAKLASRRLGVTSDDVSTGTSASCFFMASSSSRSQSLSFSVICAIAAAILLMITSIARTWPRRFSTESSPSCCGRKHMMDDGGRYGNVPPNPLQNTVSEKEEIGGSAATDAPCNSRKYAEEEVCKTFSVPASEIEGKR